MAHSWVRWVLTGICVFAHTAPASIGVALVSDIHAYYGNLENLVRQIAYERHRFYEADPTGTFVVVANGDNAGLSGYSYYWEDKGELIYSWYEVVASTPRTRLVVGMGNHDGFDNEGVEGNRAFFEQTSRLVRNVSRVQRSPFRVTNANLHLTGAGSSMVAPYQDIETSQGRVRFVGFVLDEFFKKCGYTSKDGLQYFAGMTPALELVDSIFDQAVADGVTTLVPLDHDYAERVAGVKAAFDARNEKLPREKRLHIPWAMAAHDHIQAIDTKSGVLDAGSNGAVVFSTVNDDGSRGRTSAYAPGMVEEEASWNTDAYLSDEERQFLASARPRIEGTRRELATIVGYAPSDLFRKAAVKKGPTASGILMADAMRMWAEERFMPALRGQRGAPKAVVGFWNSSSYRYDYDIPEGRPITNEMLFGMYPLAGRPPRRGELFGATIVELYATARAERMLRDQTFTPQLSRNLREVRTANKGLTLEHYDSRGHRWLPVQPADRFVLAIDGFLATNGYLIPGWDELLSKIAWFDEPTPPRQRSIVLEYVPRLLSPTSCSMAIANAGK